MKLVILLMSIITYGLIIDAGYRYVVDGYGIHPYACIFIAIAYSTLVFIQWIEHDT